MRPQWEIDGHPTRSTSWDYIIVDWVVFRHVGRMESWNEAVEWCANRLGHYLDADPRWMLNGIEDRLAIRDPNDAFEFRMRFC